METVLLFNFRVSGLAGKKKRKNQPVILTLRASFWGVFFFLDVLFDKVKLSLKEALDNHKMEKDIS